MTSIGFTIAFHGQFRVGAAQGRDGIGAAVDHDMPLPGDHLKGLMRAAARDVLGFNERQVAEVFGGHADPCPWSWTSAEPVDEWRFGIRHRVKIDPDSHSAIEDHLVAGEYAHSSEAHFQVVLMGAVAPDRLPWHQLVLRATAAGVHGLGSWRRRGLGWVGIKPDEPLTDTEIQRLVTARPVRAGR